MKLHDRSGERQAEPAPLGASLGVVADLGERFQRALDTQQSQSLRGEVEEFLEKVKAA